MRPSSIACESTLLTVRPMFSMLFRLRPFLRHSAIRVRQFMREIIATGLSPRIGRIWRLRLVRYYLEPPGPVVLDFAGIQVLTSSYFFATLWPFWTREDADGPSTFPLIANASPDVAEELEFVMKHRRIAA
jgi:hypothetical protein